MTMMFLKIFFREKKTKQTKIGISFKKKKRIVPFSLTEAIINVDIYMGYSILPIYIHVYWFVFSS